MNPINIDEVFEEIGKINQAVYGIDPYAEKEEEEEPEEISEKEELRQRYGI